MSKILLTGGAGYIGSIATRELLKAGYKLRIFDKFYFGRDSLKEVESEVEIVEGDIRNFDERILDGISAIIHLAALSNDPTAEYDPVGNMQINYEGTKNLAELSKKKKIKRFIYASSCSIYDRGIIEDKLDTEFEIVSPVAAYSLSKYKGEQVLLSLVDDDFSPVILRQGTVYGMSPRMRYDLVVNTMVKDAILSNKIFVISGGLMWRPLIDVEDVSQCYILLLSAEENKIKGEIFNILYKNYKIADLAKEVKDTLSDKLKIKIEEKEARTTIRSYKVSKDKIEKSLGFKSNISISSSVKKMFNTIESGKYNDFENPIYYNIEWMKKNYKP